MKKAYLIFVMLSFAMSAISQNKATEVFSANELVWYGLDFSEARFVGLFDQAVGAGEASSLDIKQNYIPAWNNLIISEPRKYDIAKSFRKSSVFNDLTAVERNNTRINDSKLLTNNDYVFSNAAATVEKMVSGYGKGQKSSGVGLVFVVESFNKSKLEATVYVTLFDIATKDILFTEKVVGKPRGIGLRNFWGGAIFNILKEIEKKHYNYWRKKYSQ